jgi:hypothetical protein
LVNWKYFSTTEPRDLRLDFLRGYFVFVMTVDHLAMFPAWTSLLTGANRLWISAAIGFIIISGLVLGSLYRCRVKEKGWNWSVMQIGRRAIMLYLLSAISRLILATGDYVLRLFWERPSPLPENYWRLVEGALLSTRYWFAYVDMLTLYAFLLPMGLGAIYLIRQGKWKWVTLGSFLLWVAGRTDPAAFSFLRIGFNVFLWQFPFTLSVIIGYYRQEIGRWWGKRPFPKPTSTLLVCSTFALLIINYLIVFHGLWPGIDWKEVNSLIFDKFSVDPGRILVAFWVFAGAYKLITQFWTVWQKLLGWLLLPLGQNALIAYLVQGFLSYFISRLPGFPFPDHDPIIMGFLHLGVVLFVWQVTRSIAHFLDNPRLTWLASPSNALKTSPETKG